MLLAVTRDGYGKRLEASAFGKKGRGGMGMIAIKFKEEGDELKALTQANDGEQVLLLLTQKGPQPPNPSPSPNRVLTLTLATNPKPHLHPHPTVTALTARATGAADHAEGDHRAPERLGDLAAGRVGQ